MRQWCLRTVRSLKILLLVLLFCNPARAQSTVQRVVITPQNVQQIKQVATLGRGWVNGLAWSPDNHTLAVASSTGIWLYDNNDPDKEPRHFSLEYKEYNGDEKMRFSPDGSRLVSIDFYRVTIWDVATGRQLGQFIQPHDDEPIDSYVQDIRFDKAGHTILVTWLRNDGYALVDMDSKVTLYSVSVSNEDVPYFSPDLSKVATCPGSIFDPNKVCKVVDLKTKRLLATLKNYSNPVWSPDSQAFADEPDNNGDTIKIWFAVDNHEITIKSGKAYNVRWSPNNRFIAADGDSKTYIWQVATGKEISQLARDLYPDAVFSPDSRSLIGLDDKGNNYSVVVWKFQQIIAPTVFNSGDYEGYPSCLAVSPDGQHVAASGLSNLVHILSTDKPNETPTNLRHNGIPESLAFSADNKTLAVGMGSITTVSQGSSDNAIWLWNTADYTTKRILDGHIERVMTLDFSADGKFLVSGTAAYDGSRVWDLENGETFVSLTGDVPAIGAVIRPDEREVAVASFYNDPSDPSIPPILSYSTGFRRLPNPPHRPPTGLSSRPIAFSNDGTLFAVIGVVYDTKTELELFDTNQNQNPAAYASSVAFSPDDKFLAVGQGINAAVELWSVPKGKLQASWKFDNYFYDYGDGAGNQIRVAFNPDGSLLAAGGSGSLLLIDVVHGQVIMTLHSPGEAEIHSIAWSPDGKTLAVGSAEGTVRLWGVETEIDEF